MNVFYLNKRIRSPQLVLPASVTSVHWRGLSPIRTKVAAKPQTDKSFWDRVYNPDYSGVGDQWKTATGTIKKLDHNEDGDTHMLLKLDRGAG